MNAPGLFLNESCLLLNLCFLIDSSLIDVLNLVLDFLDLKVLTIMMVPHHVKTVKRKSILNLIADVCKRKRLLTRVVLVLGFVLKLVYHVPAALVVAAKVKQVVQQMRLVLFKQLTEQAMLFLR